MRDARAVEDPIAAIFDLAESVDRETPKIRKTLRYVRWFVSLWLLLDFFLIIVLSAITGFPAITFLLFIPITAILLGMRRISGRNGRLALLVFAGIFGALQIVSMGGLLFLGIVLVALFILGFLILELMQDLRSFFDYFALRHRVIQRVRQADPVVYVPEGKDAVQRILSHLAGTSPDVRGIMATPGSIAVPALLTGKTGLTYSFDAYIRQPPTPVWRVLKAAVEDVAIATRIPPARILVLWRAKKDESVTPDVYDFLTKEAVQVRIRGSTFACSLELAVERADGTYDFIPLVVESAVPSGGRPAPA